MSDSSKPILNSEVEAAIARFAEASKRGDIEQQQLAGLEVMFAVGTAAEQDQEFLHSPEIRAAEFVARGRWAEASRIYEDALASKETSSCQLLIHYSGVCRLFGEEQHAIGLLQQALLMEEPQDPSNVVWTMTALMVGSYLLNGGQITKAKELADKCLQGLDDQFDRIRADVFLFRARCQTIDGEFDLAHSDLESAWELLEKYDAHPLMFGIQDSIADYWSTVAQLQRKQRAFGEAIESMRRSIAKRTWVASSPFDYPTWREIRLAADLSKFGEDLRKSGRWLAAVTANVRSKLLFARYRLNSHGRVPVSILARLGVSIFQAIDRPLCWYS